MSNGKPIDWKYWADRKSIDPRQAAILSYGIDPIEWPDGTFKSGEWPKALREKIQRLYEWLAERNDSYTLPDLVAHLGENFASFLMKEAVLTPEAISTLQTDAAVGIRKDQVLIAFGDLVSIDLESALGNGTGLFGDTRSRSQKGTRGRGGHKSLWNPVILAIGLHEDYRVPMPKLKKTFFENQFLRDWSEEFHDKIKFLGM